MKPSDAFKFNPLNGKKFTRINDGFLKEEETGFNFFISPKPTASAIIRSNSGNILLTERAVDPGKGTWDLPGGFVDIEETLEEALLREMDEELGAEIGNIKYFHSYTNRYLYQEVNYYLVDVVFTAELISDETNIKAKDDISEVEFFKPKDIPFEKIVMEGIKKALQEYVKDHT